MRLLLNTPTPTRESSIDVKPFSVRLNLHGDLDFFLGSKAGRRRLERSLSEKTSVKDVIESCGVPHPEVDLILVNGMPVDFDYGVMSDAEIELYPPGIGHPHFKEKRLQIATIGRFVADGHLGRLTRNLRLLGFDVAYDSQAQDRQLLALMEHENRALLTRDRRLLMYAIVKTGYYPRSQNADEQTTEGHRAERLDHCDRDDCNQGQQRRNNHLAQSRFRHDIHAGSIFRSVLTGQNSWFRLQLPAHLAHDCAGCLAYSVHAERRESERQQSAEEKSNNYFWFRQRELIRKDAAMSSDVPA